MSETTICIFSTFYYPNLGGVEKFTDNIATTLVRQNDCRVILVTSSLDGVTGISEKDGIEIVHVPSRLLLNKRFAAPRKNHDFARIVEWLDEQPIDFILVNQRFYPLSLFGMAYAQSRDIIPLVMDHGSAHLTMSNSFLDVFIKAYEHWITNKGKKFDNRYIAVSEESAKWLSHFGIEAIGVVNNSIDADSFLSYKSDRNFREELSIGENDFLVVFTGRLMKEKGLLPLCGAITALSDIGHQDIHLAIAGTGPLEIEIADLGSENIHLLGRLSQEDIAALLSEGDIFCLPTVSEGFSTSMLEAAAAGMGIIVTRTGGVGELIPDDRYGIVIPDSQPKTIKDAILAFYNDRNLLQECSKNVANRVKERLAWNNAAASLMELFSKAQVS